MWQLATEGSAQGIWFWGAIYAFALAGYSLLYQLRTRAWPWVEGELLTVEVEKFGQPDTVLSEQDFQSRALYRYEVSGQRYAGSRVSPWVVLASRNARVVLEKQLAGIQRTGEGRARVFYNPAKPGKSFLIVAGPAGLLVTACIATLPGVLFYLEFHS